jgi:hypothetical protein
MCPNFLKQSNWLKKIGICKLEYLSDFREAASSAAAPGVEYFVTYDCANGQITVTSHASGLPSRHGKRVSPSGHLLSLMDNPVGSFVTRMSAVTNALAMTSLSAVC